MREGRATFAGFSWSPSGNCGSPEATGRNGGAAHCSLFQTPGSSRSTGGHRREQASETALLKGPVKDPQWKSRDVAAPSQSPNL